VRVRRRLCGRTADGVAVLFVLFSPLVAESVQTGGVRARRWSLARQLLVLQIVLLTVVLLAAAAAAVQISRDRQESAARDKVLSLAQSIAANPFVVAQAVTANPSLRLQPYAERIRRETDVDFVVIMAPDRTRWSHPNTAEIGKPFIGDIEPALHGHAFTETYTGTLGPSVRAVAPVRDAQGRIVALVSDGITTEALHEQLLRQLPFLIVALAVLFIVALLGAALVSRRLRRQTRGADAQTLAQLFASHEAVLHSIREGLLVTDHDGRVGVVNDEACRLLGIEADVTGMPAAELQVAESVHELLTSGRSADDELHLTEDRVLVVNQLPVEWQGKRYGTVTTLRDRTELEALTGELDSTKAFAESLRSQAHETANRLHTMIVLIETGRSDEAVRYATSQLELSQQLTDRVMAAVDEPVLAALLLGKTAQAAERNVELRLAVDGTVGASGIPPNDLVTVVGNLVDNAIDASAESTGARTVTVTLRATDDEVSVQVDDSGRGLPDELIESAFTRGWSTKTARTQGGRGLGLALVRQTVVRHGGGVSVARSADGGASFQVRLPVRGRVGAP
jgi:two-component system CitB family sensor kinase